MRGENWKKWGHKQKRNLQTQEQEMRGGTMSENKGRGGGDKKQHEKEGQVQKARATHEAVRFWIVNEWDEYEHDRNVSKQ